MEKLVHCKQKKRTSINRRPKERTHLPLLDLSVSPQVKMSLVPLLLPIANGYSTHSPLAQNIGELTATDIDKVIQYGRDVRGLAKRYEEHERAVAIPAKVSSQRVTQFLDIIRNTFPSRCLGDSQEQVAQENRRQGGHPRGRHHAQREPQHAQARTSPMPLSDSLNPRETSSYLPSL